MGHGSSNRGSCRDEFNAAASGAPKAVATPRQSIREVFANSHDGPQETIATPKMQLIAKPSPATVQAVHSELDEQARRRNRVLETYATAATNREKLPPRREFNWQSRQGLASELLPMPTTPKVFVSPPLRSNLYADRTMDQAKTTKLVRPQFNAAAGVMTADQIEEHKKKFAERLHAKCQARRRQHPER